MATIKLEYGSEFRRLSEIPKSYQELKEKVYEFFQEREPLIQYKDHEGDLITISSEPEYQEALSSSENALLKLIVKASDFKSSLLLNIPLANSESDKESEESMVLLSPTNEQTDAYSFPTEDKAFETQPVESVDVSILAMPDVNESACCTQPSTSEKANLTNEVLTQEQECGVPLSETGCDALEINTQETSTEPVKTSSVAVETPKPLTESKNLGTQAMFSISLNPKEEVNPALLESLRDIVREELQKKSQTSRVLVKHEAQCSECSQYPILGVRYYCAECELSLCEDCEEQTDHQHDMFKLRKPDSMPKSPKQHLKEEVKEPPKEESKVVAPKVEIDFSGSHFVRPTGKQMKQMVNQFENLGFTDQEKIMRSLVKANFNLEVAADMLIDSSSC